ncbi:MAG: sulfate transporter CysZ [Agarilytica sp.]
MLPPPRYKNNIASGVYYFNEGLRLVWRKELRLYLVVPLLVNCVLFFFLTATLIYYFSSITDSAMQLLPSFLEPLAWIALIVLGIIMLILYAYSFNMITNILAAPFYGFLAAEAERILTGKAPPEESMGEMIRRTLKRELIKLWYFLNRGILVMLIMILVGTIPVVNILAPLIGIAWSAWTMSIQYADYAADNHQLEFSPLRQCLWQKKYSCLGFGGFITFCSIIPVINIIAMPVAVVGGTLFWLRELKHCPQGGCPKENALSTSSDTSGD